MCSHWPRIDHYLVTIFVLDDFSSLIGTHLRSPSLSQAFLWQEIPDHCLLGLANECSILLEKLDVVETLSHTLSASLSSSVCVSLELLVY